MEEKELDKETEQELLEGQEMGHIRNVFSKAAICPRTK